MARVYLSLGSNLGDKVNYLKQAVEHLQKHEKIIITKTSSLYETSPVDYENQDNFINQVIEIETTLSPYELLAYCQEIENNLGRKRIIRFGPRTIDLDILLYNDLQLNEEDLIIPHPRMTNRAFVLIPLFEINKNIFINDVAISDLVERIKEKNDYIKKYLND